jgi:hypothetical protein
LHTLFTDLIVLPTGFAVQNINRERRCRVAQPGNIKPYREIPVPAFAEQPAQFPGPVFLQLRDRMRRPEAMSSRGIYKALTLCMPSPLKALIHAEAGATWQVFVTCNKA